MRLDVYLTEHGFAGSRTEAKNFIISGAVTLGGKTVNKPSFDVDEAVADVVVDKSMKKYTSRGGLKLEAALDAFALSPEGRECIDVGASSGGFTDCLLKRGALHVIAVDSGHGQLASALSSDRRVTSIENYNARYMRREDLEYSPSFAVMDVSFISATYIIPSLRGVLVPGADFVCLIKPQFEVGRSGLGKGGIVKNDKIRKDAVDKVIMFASSYGFVMEGLIESPITGGDGNVEYLAHFKLEEEHK